jgi:F0F1-type ATP synthase assembly protein I
MDDGRGDKGANRGNRGSPVGGAEFAGIGVQFGLTILVFAFAGVWLDRRFGTSPWLLLICVFTGAGGAFYSMYRRVTATQRDAKHKK